MRSVGGSMYEWGFEDGRASVDVLADVDRAYI